MKVKRVCSFALALIVSLSFCITAFAKTVNYESGKIQFFMRSGSNTESLNGTIPFHFLASNIKQTTLQYCDLIFTENFNLQKNEQLTFNIELGAKRYSNMSATAFIYSDNGDFKFLLNYSYQDKQTLSGSFMADKDYNNCSVVIRCNSFTYGDYNEADKLNAYMEVLSASYSIDSEESGFFDNVGKWFQELFQKIKDLGTSIKNGFSSIVSSVSEWFGDLFSKLQGWFDDVGKWFSDLGDNIKQWFIDITNDIGDFFNKLWNKIWWGNENGESDYEKPVINNKLNDILAKLEEYQQQLKNAIDKIGSSATEISQYIKTGTQFVNGVVGVAGVGFTALITFGIVFVLVRKVVGR